MTWSLTWEGALADVTADGELPDDASYGGADAQHPLAVAAFAGAVAMARSAGFARIRVNASGVVESEPAQHGQQSLVLNGLLDPDQTGPPELGGAGEHEGPVGPEQVMGPDGVTTVPGTGDPEHPDHVPG